MKLIVLTRDRSSSNRKFFCPICKTNLKIGDMVMSRIFLGSESHKKPHFKCIILNSENAPTKEQYGKIYDEWMIKHL